MPAPSPCASVHWYAPRSIAAFACSAVKLFGDTAVMVLVALVATLLLSATVSTTSYVPDSVNWCDAVAPVAELPSPKSHAYDTIWAPFDGVAIELKSNVSGAISITEMLAEGEVGAQNPTPFGP